MEKVVDLPLSLVENEENEELVNNAIERALRSLNAGEVIAVPTDTIYGVAALSQSTDAVNKLYEIKKRDKGRAIAICVGTIEDVKRWGIVTVSDEILNDLLPGPVTLIFQRSPDLNPHLNPSARTIGIRIPEHKFIKKLAVKCKQPFALTSANVSSEPSTLEPSEFQHLFPQLDLVINGGRIVDNSQSRAGSTVVDFSGVEGQFTIIREGCAYEHVVSILRDKYCLLNTKELTS